MFASCPGGVAFDNTVFTDEGSPVIKIVFGVASDEVVAKGKVDEVHETRTLLPDVLGWAFSLCAVFR